MVLNGQKIAIIGCGNMGLALAQGLVAGGLEPKALALSDPSPEAVDRAKALGLPVANSNRNSVQGANIVLLAVKPEGLEGLGPDLKGHVGGALIISIMAGVPIDRIIGGIGGTRVIRAMPNTPALIRKGATALAAGGEAGPPDLALAKEIFDLVGTTVIVKESHLDAVTGLSGSGPAYVFVILEALADAGVNMGLPRQAAHELATQTLLGAAALAQSTGDHPGRLKDQVTSPGGTTIAGVAALEAHGLRRALMAAVEAATRRARALGGKTSDPP